MFNMREPACTITYLRTLHKSFYLYLCRCLELWVKYVTNICASAWNYQKKQEKTNTSAVWEAEPCKLRSGAWSVWKLCSTLWLHTDLKHSLTNKQLECHVIPQHLVMITPIFVKYKKVLQFFHLAGNSDRGNAQVGLSLNVLQCLLLESKA